MTLKQDLDRLSAAIRGDEPDIAAALLTPETAARISIYRSAYRATLRRVLEESYPATCTLLGRNARLFIWRYTQAHPSTEDSLDHYGNGFPEFLAAQPEIAQTQPALIHFAQLDRALHHSQSPTTVELELPEHLPHHYAHLLATDQLADLPLGEPRLFRFER
ncbi:MAG: DNA-binding domain-containing protein [Myxococcota bacterium]